jgi:hypothetical protein
MHAPLVSWNRSQNPDIGNMFLPLEEFGQHADPAPRIAWEGESS